MQPLTAQPEDGPAPPVQQSFDFDAAPKGAGRSPGPSRLAFRLMRLWKKAWVRRMVFVGTPLVLVAVLAGRLAVDPAVHAWVAEQRAATMDRLSTRPEFAIRGARVMGASRKLERAIRDVVALPPGASTLNFDVAGAQLAVNRMPAVRAARVTLAPDGLLDIHVDERRPSALWRDANGQLWLVDTDGVAIGTAAARADHPRLPLVLGQDADATVEEALAILRAAPDLKPRVRAFVRIGQRRWNVVLDRNLTIMLPEVDAPAALARVMAWHYGEKILERGLSHIDMRIAERPTLRMTPRALELRPLDEKLRDGTGEET